MHGKNVLLDHEGQQLKGGFYTARIVEAMSQAQAKELAINQVWETSGLNEYALNKADDPINIDAEEIELIEKDDNREIGGMALYIETEDEKVKYTTRE